MSEATTIEGEPKLKRRHLVKVRRSGSRKWEYWGKNGEVVTSQMVALLLLHEEACLLATRLTNENTVRTAVVAARK